MTARARDIAVLGAGCSGLHLALALIERCYPGKVTLFEARPSYHNDRTWSFFTEEPNAFPYLRHTWAEIEVGAQGQRAHYNTAPFVYANTNASAFIGYALEAIRKAPRTQLELGVRADVDLSGRKPWTGGLAWDFVVDTRPQMPAPGTLLQHFLGAFVEFPDPRLAPFMDASGKPKRCVLMDFYPPKSSSVRFMYLLPFSEKKGLFEVTHFSLSRVTQSTYLNDLSAYLGAHFPGPHRIVRMEKGVLPMSATPTPERIHPDYVEIGSRGGALKPSTGYGFLAMRAQAAALADAIMCDAGTISLPPARPARKRAVDAIFLDYLIHHFADGPMLYQRLFANNPTRRLIRFLGDTSSLNEDLQVMASVPLLPFARTLLTRLLPFAR